MRMHLFVLVATASALMAPPSSRGLTSRGISRPSGQITSRGVSTPSGQRRSVALSADATSLVALGTNADITTLFNVATFGPQPLWILMILSGCGVGKGLADAVMKPWWPVIAFSLVHVAIVVISATQADGVAPIAEFNQVFDSTGFPFSPAPQQAMYHMMD